MSDQSTSDAAGMANQLNAHRHSSLPNPRRVVTGHDQTGKAIVSMDDPIELQDSPDRTFRMRNIWTTESAPTRDNVTNVDGATRPIPGLGLILPHGVNHQVVELAPGQTIAMHRTSSVDYNILITGRLVLIVDDDVRTEIRAGDVIVQRGTLHGWHNPSATEWARWVSVLIDAEPVKVNGVELEEVWQL